jgi:hypothetical protein
MTETTSTVVVAGNVVVVGGSAGTLIEPALTNTDAASLGKALKRPGPGTAATEYVDAVSEATLASRRRRPASRPSPTAGS